MVNLKEYDNGLKLVVKKMDGVMSVSVGVWVGAGSRLETDKNNGISHFLEHMTFKGTEKLTAFELSESFDEIGSQPNAFTSKEKRVRFDLLKIKIPYILRRLIQQCDMVNITNVL